MNFDPWYILFGGSLSLSTSVLNALVLYLFWARPSLRVNSSNWFFAYLAFLDFIVGAFCIPGRIIIHTLDIDLDLNSCKGMYFLFAFFTVNSVTQLMFITINRYIRIYFYKYVRYNPTVSSTVIPCLAGSMFHALGLIPIVIVIDGFNDYKSCLSPTLPKKSDGCPRMWAAYIILLVIPLCLMVIGNYRIYRTFTEFVSTVEDRVNRGSHPSEQVSVVIVDGRAVVNPRPASAILNNNNHQFRQLSSWIYSSRKQKRVAILLLVISLTAVVCVFPPTLMYMVNECCSSCDLNNNMANYLGHGMARVLNFTHPWFIYLNALLDPIILFSISEDFRRPIFRMYQQLRCGPSSS